MDKNAIKKYAVWARRELISRVSQKALQYGITETDSEPASATSVHGVVLSKEEIQQRNALLERIAQKGYEQAIEEVAYTWFNRFIALRFMEVNGYLPSHVRVFTDEENNFKPQILTEAINLELDGLDMERVYALKDANDNETLFKYLVITQCNALSAILPGMFEKIADDTELLFPDNLLRDGSVIEQMVALIPQEDWKDAVQILGWLYQYYNSEKKDEVFAALKKNVKITKENIPAATQLFTPDWIVRYMVENSLGRLWVEGHPNDELKSQWNYYLDEAEQEPEVEAQLAEIRKDYAALTPEKMKCIDPCCGSGHILAYLFDVLMQIYEAYGYTSREAVASIVQNNIYGLDIDDRAAQLAYFAVMMKARQYDRRFFRRGIQPNVYAIQESNRLDKFAVEYFVGDDEHLTHDLHTLIEELHDAKEYGSILNISQVDFQSLYNRFDEICDDISMHKDTALNQLLPLVQCAEAMAQKYDVVVTNPPYMGGSGMSAKLSALVKKQYPDSKSDLFAVFIEKCGQMAKQNGYQTMITQHAWMFLSSFEKLRTKLLHMDTVNMAHLGARAFEEIGGEVVQTTSFVLRKSHMTSYIGTYCRLIEPTTQQGKEEMFLTKKQQYAVPMKRYKSMPKTRFIYWIGTDELWRHKCVSSQLISGGRNKTHNNDKYVREWWEIIPSSKWVFYMNGGNYRKWYGNLVEVVNWSSDAKKEYASHGGLVDEENVRSYGISWNGICGDLYGFRIKPQNIPFSSSSPTIVTRSDVPPYTVLSLLNSKVGKTILSALNPTLQLNVGEVLDSPLVMPDEPKRIEKIAEGNVIHAKNDWDSFETSWDFQRHPLIRPVSSIAEAFSQWETECNARFNRLKANEEELNRIFIDIYGLQDELTPEVADKNVTVHYIVDSKDDIPESLRGSNYVRTKRDEMVSLISYAVGCMFGRYSLDVEGLAYAGGEWDDSKYKTFPADTDNIIPICDDEYFDDDIVGRFVDFIRVVYGEETLSENLKFIADALGGKGQPKEVIRSYFMNDFYADHCKTYQKRPIYWLFDSGKKGGFKCLIYLHRYQPDTIARIRTDYVHEQQSRYRTGIGDLEKRIADASTAERVKLTKQLKKLQNQADEIHEYEEKIHHLADQMIAIDLDDGVKKNYALFQDVLAKIK
jgi:hypothetical protein